MFQIAEDFEGHEYTYPAFGTGDFRTLDQPTLTEALNAAEMHLTDFLDKHGYDVEFA